MEIDELITRNWRRSSLAFLIINLTFVFQTQSTHSLHRHGHGSLKTLENVTAPDISKAIAYSVDIVSKLSAHETVIQMNQLNVPNEITPYNEPSYDQRRSQTLYKNAREAYVAVKASQLMAHKYCLRFGKSVSECASLLSLLSLNGTCLYGTCQSLYNADSLTCAQRSAQYRSLDGTCNNELRASWGRSNTAYGRLMRPKYDDGFIAVRGSSIGAHALPSARLVTNTLSENRLKTDSDTTMALNFWALFIGRDLSHTLTSNTLTLSSRIVCCTSDGRPLNPRFQHVLCAPISIAHNDSVFGRHFQSCMNYVRSVPTIRPDCNLGPIEQNNEATHFLDGSMIYGSDPEVGFMLRTMSGGRLTTRDENARNSRQKDIPDKFISDSRATVIPELAALHVLFVREHNRIADRLAELNARWSDERVYQETRRIMVAQIQRVTYSEWLPLVLGESFNETAFYGDSYDKNINPAIGNEFASAALPFIYSIFNGKRHEREFVSGNASQRLNVEKIIADMTAGSLNQTNAEFKEILTRYWISRDENFVVDSLTLDIQRGRDHGIPGYNDFRSSAGLKAATSFEDLLDTFSKQDVEKLKSIYRSPNDIDLIAGLALEKRVNDERGSIPGPVTRFVISEQFYRTRVGDRYFYDNENQPSPFTQEQLVQLKRSSLARIFCDNSRIAALPANVFKYVSSENELRKCEGTEIPFVDLNAWKE